MSALTCNRRATVAHPDTAFALSISAGWFTVVVIAFVALSATAVVAAPLLMAVAIVFLFAGPHNYFEARYILTRLPARAGKLLPFFVLSAAGVLLLGTFFALQIWLPRMVIVNGNHSLYAIAIWNSLFVLWCTSLFHLRKMRSAKDSWPYLWPVGLTITGVFWLQPVLLPLLLIYVHPLMALVILDRELGRSRPPLKSAYRGCLLLVPLAVALIWFSVPDISDAIPAPSISPHIQQQISGHTGTSLFPAHRATQIIATHTFLEGLHYGVWIAAMPFVSGRLFGRKFLTIPLLRKENGVGVCVKIILAIAALLMALLWLGFAMDYSTTRDVYFTIAIVHVLAEFPLLLRL